MARQQSKSAGVVARLIQFGLLSAGLLFQSELFAFTLNVVNADGTPITGGFRWVLQEDISYRQPLGSFVGPGDPGAENVQGFNFYKSHMPVRASGSVDAASAEVAIPETGKHYYISILAKNAEYQISGRQVAPGSGGAYGPVTVVLNRGPVPTAQILVVAFRDDNSINGAYEQLNGQEVGIGGFTVRIDDTIDQVKQDAFGNMLGTVYQRNPDGSPVLDIDGNPVVQCAGDGVVRTVTQADVNAGGCRNPYNLDVGEALIKNLSPGKYGIKVIPPTGSTWQQSATIEGTKTIDAWVKGNEPPYFAEFGAGVWHASFGFVRPFNLLAAGGTGTIGGRIVNMHMSRPPVYTFFSGHPLENCWVGLNETIAGGLPGRGLYVAPCEPGATFSIPNVPAGTYQLVMFDRYLDNIIGYHTIVVPDGGTVALGDVPVFRWFATHDHYVFYDANENGIRDDGETGIPEQAVNLRYRDGSIYSSFPTDRDGFVPFEEVFPFFFWQVAEVDFARYKATGLTVTIDAGGAVDPTLGEGKMTPQTQADGVSKQRSEQGLVLTQGFQSFIGTTNRFEWGKKEYAAGENGGISGIVHYATTRAEDDPRLTGAEDWEPGVPRVQVNLYLDSNADSVIDDVNGIAGIQLADVDNYPVGNFPAAEDLDRNGNGVFEAGDAVNIARTDSWDDNVPTECPAGNDPGAATDVFYQNGKCYDGQRNYNQVRPALFDGGYAFLDYVPGGADSGAAAVTLTPGYYIVESATPSGYLHQREEDKNVDFGDAYVPSALLLPPLCVGDAHVVPAELTLYPGIAAPFAGESRKLCDRKQVLLADRQNAAADFFLFTEVPIAGQMQGFVLNDLANEFDVNAANFGEKQAMPFLPISIRDWTGKQVSRVYSDQYGNYNGLVPGTATMNRPSPSGVAQAVHQICVNDPGPIPDPANPGTMITDPYFSRQHTQFCYEMNFLSGRVTFLDTPVLPIAAFANLGINPVDSEFPAGTPMIYSVDNALPTVGGPYVPAITAAAANPRTLAIVSAGTVQVPNPAFTIEGTEPRNIPRDFGFGTTPGTARLWLGGTTVTLNVTSWTDGSITAVVPQNTAAGDYQLTVTRGDNGRSSLMGVTVRLGSTAVVNVPPGGSIQAAIDSAAANALVLVPPGNYDEMVIMYKPVRLQGWGAGSTIINATLTPSEKIELWRQKMSSLIASNQVTLLPDQADPRQDVEGFLGSEGAPIFVVAKQAGTGVTTSFTSARRARIDGFTIAGSNGSSGIAVNSYANFLTVSNNRVTNNQGIYGGGVRLGQPLLDGAVNNNVTIRNNQICENGTLQTPGGGVAMYAGANNYSIADNWICANFAQGDGGGIAHLGLSQNGTIARNQILFNQTFEQTAGVGGAGGGILIAGEPVAAGLTPGSGSVTIEGNLIQGNQAGTGDGGGIATLRVNGADVNSARLDPTRWYRIDIFDNVLVNNVTGLAGGGIALQDTLRSRIIQNTVAHNDSTATSIGAFESSPTCTATANQSCPQPAGVISRVNSSSLQGVLNLTGLGCGFATFPREYCPFSQPLLTNSIVWQNRSFYYTQTPTPADPPVPGTQLVGQLLPDPGTPVFNDLAVLGVAGSLDPRNSVLTDTTGYHASNTSGDPLFVNSYFNGDRALSIVQPEFTTSLTVRPALDEGGNFLDVTFGPLALTGDYHLQTGSAAFQRGDLVQLLQSFLLLTDYDNALRPICLLPDAGADELVTACALATATAPAAVTTANTPLTLSVTALGVSLHSAGGGGAPLAAIAVRTPTANGATVAMSEDRSQLTYTPATNWTGADTLVAVVSDGVNLRTTTATVTVNPNTADASAGDAPTQPAATADAAGSVTAEGVASVAADSVPAGSSGRSGPLSYALAGMPLEEAAYLAKAQLPEEMAEPANEAPSVSNDEFAVWEYDVGKGYYVFADFSVLDNDHDADGDHMKAELVEDVKVGRVKLAADGTFTYVPAAKGKTPKGALSFKYRVSDGKTTSELATVTFTVQKVTKGAAKPGAKQDGAKLKPSSGKPDTTVSPPAVKANGATEKSQINSAQASATTRR